MPSRNPSGWLAHMLGAIDFQLNGVDESVERRSVWNFIGSVAVADDPDNDRTNITLGASVTLPITDAALVGAARTLTLFEHTDLGGTADQLCVGGDAAFTSTKTVDYLTFFAKTAIDWSCGVSSTMSCTVDGVTINNGKYIGCLPATDVSVLPTTGAIRLAQGLAIYSTNVANDRNILLVRVDGSNYVTIGDTGGSFIQLLAGAGGSDMILTAGAYSMRLAGGTLSLSFPETVNAGTVQGETRTREDVTKTTGAPGTLSTYVTTADSMSVLDAEVVALKSDGSIGMRAKISIGVLNVGGVLSADTPDATTPSFIGGAPAWSLSFNLAAPNVELVGDPGADTVTWYVVRAGMRTVAAP